MKIVNKLLLSSLAIFIFLNLTLSMEGEEGEKQLKDPMSEISIPEEPDIISNLPSSLPSDKQDSEISDPEDRRDPVIDTFVNVQSPIEKPLEADTISKDLEPAIVPPTVPLTEDTGQTKQVREVESPKKQLKSKGYLSSLFNLWTAPLTESVIESTVKVIEDLDNIEHDKGDKSSKDSSEPLQTSSSSQKLVVDKDSQRMQNPLSYFSFSFKNLKDILSKILAIFTFDIPVYAFIGFFIYSFSWIVGLFTKFLPFLFL